MPFDFSRSPHDALQSVVHASGLRILDLDLLDQHKATELRRHPPNWGYRHRSALQIGFGIVLIVGFIDLVFLDAQGASTAALAPLAVILGAVITALLAPIAARRGGRSSVTKRWSASIRLLPIRRAG